MRPDTTAVMAMPTPPLGATMTVTSMTVPSIPTKIVICRRDGASLFGIDRRSYASARPPTRPSPRMDPHS